MAARKRRTRSPHPGVYIKPRTLPGGGRGYRARYTDPDTGKEVYETLDLTALPTREARALWAKRKSEALAKRRMDLASGAPTRTHTPLGEALDEFYQAAGSRLRASTLETYRQGLERFRTWAAGEGIATTEALTSAQLTAYRRQLVSGAKRVAVKGAKRGTRRGAPKRRLAPITTNTYLTSAKILLNEWRSLGLVPALNRDLITDALKPLPVPREAPPYLAPNQIAKLLEATQRHDRDTFAMTRDERAGRLPIGTSVRYAPMMELVVFLLLSGCRRGEALALTWADVHLDATDPTGNVVGEIRLRAEATKTKKARTIGLEVSPALRQLLVNMQLRAEPGARYVFGGAQPYTVNLLKAARVRLLSEYGAPPFDWQILRSTCATYLTNSRGIFQAATVFMSAKQLGHSVPVAERSYLGVHRGIAKDAHTLEAAMQVEAQMKQLLDASRESGSTTQVRAV